MPLLAAAAFAALSAGLPATSLHGACVLPFESWEGRYRAEPARALYRSLAERGAKSVALPAFAWVEELDSVELRPWNGEARAREDLVAAIRDAHAAGLGVLLKPHVEIGRKGRRDESAWRGEIRFESPERARAWFASYRSFVKELARIAAEEKVELLAVGLELAGLSRSWPEEWARLVREVRAIHSGPLTYCANWWGEMGEIGLWRELDFIGVQAFAPLSAERRASPAELLRGAREQVASWRAEAGRWGKPLLLTEYGFKSSPAPWVEPWQWRSGPPRPLAQWQAYRALLRALEGEGPWLAGSFVWLYEAGEASPGVEDAGFSPGGKPAEELLERFWTTGRIAPQ